ncbi:DNA-binding transcriptional regulator, MarR family [Palleronia marisminoris]|uniref:MarR family protein n=1 Tax=Palleronia marisminoris TaxID=315423 RepID=A0A1Y5S8N1_9RHOB|nr:MarR family transcriptional regulator [Palleronia marisminoris]SFG67156.1 DNA-binding transcriptional regulator, MarR family [Palleronia marisminoris]SLN34289.1 MarR family protein [Palleronia marisminoris]
MRDFDLRNFLPYLLNQAAEETSIGFSQIYKDRYGMLRTEWRVLFHLGRYGDMTASEIGRLSKMHKTKISRSVRALEDKRFVAGRESTDDRRREILTLLPQGRRAFDDLVVVAEKHNADLMASFSTGERAVLIDCLQRLAAFEGLPD